MREVLCDVVIYYARSCKLSASSAKKS